MISNRRNTGKISALYYNAKKLKDCNSAIKNLIFN